MQPSSQERPFVHGRALMLGQTKLHVRGATYGTFSPATGDAGFPSRDVVAADFEAMAESHLNALRTYTVPPRWLLDLAHEHGLRVLIGLPWEQHVTFIDMPERRESIVAGVRDGVRTHAGHPAVLGYAIGNEIPASIVRWHGRRQVERFLERLYRTAKEEDPEALVTYVNYPSTEYLALPFLDFICFNVFLETESEFEAYLARLQNIAGNRPLLVTESGLDSRRNGEDSQAETLRWQIRHSFATGAAGVFVFSWTDEWHRGGAEIVDWDFGVVDRERRPKPSLGAMREAFADVPFPRDGAWPRISVVVCTHNGEPTLPECLRRLDALRYPDYEVIVVSDGSTDATDQIAEREPGATLVRIEHQGLSAARNAGIERSSGELIAFLDDDAYPDSDWLHYLAAAFRAGGCAAIGGPNIPPPGEGTIAACVGAAPGAPIHVLLTDREAEHIPGCNMAFRRDALEQIGGFDEQFRAAGDDVDVCWRLQDESLPVWFSAGAVVMHRRRDSIRRYLRQQYGYGKAEALLERKWPSRYNRAGYLSWAGRIYGQPLGRSRAQRAKIRYGTWGNALFQSVYEPALRVWPALLLMPEWFLLVLLLGVVSLLAPAWSPLAIALPLFGLGAAMSGWQALRRGWAAHPYAQAGSRAELLGRRAITSLLFALQPLARLGGRLREGLVPWRRRIGRGWALPRPRVAAIWSERWGAHSSRLAGLERELRETGARFRRGGEFDRWDLRIWAGPLGSAKLLTAVEEHGSGRQLVRCRARPRVSVAGAAGVVVLGLIAAMAAIGGAWLAAAIFGVAALALGARMIADSAAAIDVSLSALTRSSRQADAQAETVQSSVSAPAGPLEALETALERRTGEVRPGRRGDSGHVRLPGRLGPVSRRR